MKLVPLLRPTGLLVAIPIFLLAMDTACAISDAEWLKLTLKAVRMNESAFRALGKGIGGKILDFDGPKGQGTDLGLNLTDWWKVYNEPFIKKQQYPYYAMLRYPLTACTPGEGDCGMDVCFPFNRLEPRPDDQNRYCMCNPAAWGGGPGVDENGKCSTSQWGPHGKLLGIWFLVQAFVIVLPLTIYGLRTSVHLHRRISCCRKPGAPHMTMFFAQGFCISLFLWELQAGIRTNRLVDADFAYWAHIITFTVYGAFACATGFSIVLVWLAIAASSKRMRSASGLIKRTRKVVVGILVVFGLITLVCCIIDRIDLVGMAGVLFTIALIVILFVGVGRLKKMMQASANSGMTVTSTSTSTSIDGDTTDGTNPASGPKLKKVDKLVLIGTTAWWLALGYSASLVGLVGYVVFNTMKMTVVATIFSSGILFHAQMLAAWAIIHYIDMPDKVNRENKVATRRHSVELSKRESAAAAAAAAGTGNKVAPAATAAGDDEKEAARRPTN